MGTKQEPEFVGATAFLAENTALTPAEIQLFAPNVQAYAEQHAQSEIERQTPAIKLEAIRDTLRNCPDALKEFDALPDKRDAWFCLAFGVTPSLFVDYDSSDPKTERIRLFDDAKVKKWLGIDRREGGEK